MTHDYDLLTFLTQSNYIEGEDGNIEQPVRAWEYLLTQSELTHTNICKAHKILMLDKDYPPPRGYYRSVPQIDVWIGGKHKAWGLVDPLMNNWMLDHAKADKEDSIIAAHIAFEHAHPFVDGNGRIGRIILNWQRVKAGLPILIIHEAQKWAYYDWFIYSDIA